MTIDDTKQQFLAQLPPDVQAAVAVPLDELCGYFVAHLHVRDTMIDTLICERDAARVHVQALTREVQQTAAEREHWYRVVMAIQQMDLAHEQRTHTLGLQPGEAAYEVERPAAPDGA